MQFTCTASYSFLVIFEIIIFNKVCSWQHYRNCKNLQLVLPSMNLNFCLSWCAKQLLCQFSTQKTNKYIKVFIRVSFCLLQLILLSRLPDNKWWHHTILFVIMWFKVHTTTICRERLSVFSIVIKGNVWKIDRNPIAIDKVF